MIIKPSMTIMLIAALIVLSPCISYSKETDEQGQIILLNDSASAVEESDPALSKELSHLADKLEKDWEYRNANKNVPPAPVPDKHSKEFQDQINALKAASKDIADAYPLIAKGLDQMVLDLNKEVENEK